MKKVFSNIIYKAKRGHIYDTDNRRYNCFRPAITGTWEIFDAWVCDEHGNIHPGYNVSPVPVHYSVLGEVVNTITD